MSVISGSTSGSITTLSYNIPVTIEYISVVNKTGGTVTVNIFIDTGSAVHIIPYNYSISANQYFKTNDKILMGAGSTLAIITSGAIDYYITTT